jgi:hypothetical protein
VGGSAHLGSYDRPENRAQSIENIESAPGKSWLDETGSGSLPSPLIRYPIEPGRFHWPLYNVGAT